MPKHGWALVSEPTIEKPTNTFNPENLLDTDIVLDKITAICMHSNVNQLAVMALSINRNMLYCKRFQFSKWKQTEKQHNRFDDIFRRRTQLSILDAKTKQKGKSKTIREKIKIKSSKTKNYYFHAKLQSLSRLIFVFTENTFRPVEMKRNFCNITINIKFTLERWRNAIKTIQLIHCSRAPDRNQR